MKGQMTRVSTLSLSIVFSVMSLPVPVLAEALQVSDTAVEHRQSDVTAEPVYIPDENLKKSIRNELVKLGNEAASNEYYVISKEDMESLTSLSVPASFREELDLTGLEWAVNIEEVIIAGHVIHDLTPIVGLKNLKRLELPDNRLTNETIAPIAKMPLLNKLNLRNNMITDISVLQAYKSSRNFNALENRVPIKIMKPQFEFNAIDFEGNSCTLDYKSFNSKKFVKIEGTTVTVLNSTREKVTLKYISEDGKFSGILLLDLSEVNFHPDMTSLEAALESAKAENLIRADVVSVDGMDVDKDQTWVTPQTQNNLNRAIERARTIFNQQDVTQLEIDGAANDLVKAMAAYQPQVGKREVKVIEIERMESMPFEKKIAKDDSKYTDFKEITQEGKAGIQTIVEKVTFENGQEVKREEISRAVTLAPVDEITTIGTKPITVIETEIRTEEIPFKTKRVRDDRLDKGKVIVKQEGKDGKKSIVEEVTFHRGIEDYRKVISEKVIKAPIHEIVHVGTREVQKITFPGNLVLTGDSEDIKADNPVDVPHPGGEKVRRFEDIDGHWAEPVILAVSREGYFKGVSETSFDPNREISRAEFITVLGRMEGIDPGDHQISSMADIVSGSYYEGYVRWAVSEGIIKGYDDGTFGPERSITREEMATILHRLLDDNELEKSAVNTQYLDEHLINSWAKDAVRVLSQRGVIQGREDGYFAPRDALTRAEVAQLIYNIKLK